MSQTEEKSYYSQPIDEIFTRFSVDPKKGLTTQQAAQSLTLNGPNELKKKKRSFWRVIIAPIINLLIIIYLIVAILMVIFGAGSRTVVTFVILGFNAVVAIVQQLRAEKQLEALKKLSAATATVLRDGEAISLPTEQIVLGDIIKFRQGDKIPADCRIIEGQNLMLNESSLTGESEPVRKNINSEPLANQELPLQDQKNMVFLGTFVSSGNGKAVVVNIGSHTELGKISLKLEETSTGDIPLRRKMNNFAKYLGLGVIIIVCISIIYKAILLTGTGDMTWDNFKYAMVLSLDLGLKVMPINLPLLTTIVLLTGVLLMAQKGVIVRELSSTESLGRVSVICSDKTGTLTKNEMTVVKIWTPEMEYGVSGQGYEPDGIVYNINDHRKPIINNHLDQIIFSGYMNSNAILKSSQVQTILRGDGATKNVWTCLGLPTEAALIALGKKYKPNIDDTVHQYVPIKEFSFDSAIKRMSKVYQKDGKYSVFCKGATEWTLPLCTHYFNGEKKSLDEKTRQTILTAMQQNASQGYRVLTITSRELPASQIPTDWEQEKLRESIEQDLVFLGFVVILDPPRDDVKSAVLECKQAGITTVMITGDNITTGRAIASQLGIYTEGQNLAKEGKQIADLSESDFLKTTVYGRVSPEHKRIIIDRYQNMGRVVSMTGDGINDALALSMADCGVAMGITGTEVAKEAADMVITDDSFSTIASGVREGRGLFMKIRTVVYFFMCVLFSEAVVLFASSFNSNPFYELFGMWQLNLIYLTTHMFPSVGIVFGRTSRTVMNEKPRDSTEIISKNLFYLLLIQVALIGGSFALSYVLCDSGIIGISEVNKSGLPLDILLKPIEKDGVVVFRPTLTMIKARTLSFMVLFIVETLVMPMQIRRINQPITESYKDIDYKSEFLFYIPSVIILLIAIYNTEFQLFMESINWPLRFMILDGVDWIIVILFVLPTLVGFELVRAWARKKQIFF